MRHKSTDVTELELHFIKIILEKREDYECMQETNERALTGDRLGHDSGHRDMGKGWAILGGIIYWRYQEQGIWVDCQDFVTNT